MKYSSEGPFNRIIGFYCSDICKKKGTANDYKLLGYGLILMAIIVINGFAQGWNIWKYLFTPLILSLPGLYVIKVGQKYNKMHIEHWLKSNNSSLIAKGENTAVSVDPHVPEIYVKELDKDVLSCCYQSARFGKDDYCVCGRAIPKELKEIFTHPN